MPDTAECVVLHRSKEGQLVQFLDTLEQQRSTLGITDVQLSLTSLEEVFLTVAKKAELEAAQAGGNTLVTVPLPGGQGEFKVPLGDEQAFNPADGKTYRLKWAQDDDGRLVVLDCQPVHAGSEHTPTAQHHDVATLLKE